MNTSILKLEATVIRPKDDDELDGLAASISFPVECDDEAIGEALGDHDLMAYVVGELHDLVVRMRPEWLDNEDTSLTIKAFLDEAEYQTFKGLVAASESTKRCCPHQQTRDAHCAVVLHGVRYSGKTRDYHSPRQGTRGTVGDSQRQVPA